MYAAAADRATDYPSQGGVKDMRPRPGEEKTNLELPRTILGLLGKPESLIAFVKDRLGHDRRYALDSTKLRRELGWQPAYSFEHRA